MAHVGGDFKIHPWENRVLSALECADPASALDPSAVRRCSQRPAAEELAAK
jgi:hypothetical protein